MIRLRTYVLALFLLPLAGTVAQSQMRDERDRVISGEMIDLFRRECSHKSGVDQGKIQELQEIFVKVRADKSPNGLSALGCYQERMSQMIGIHQLYKDLCSEVSGSDMETKSEDDKLRILVMTQRYRRGITPFHDLLNDCLLEKSDSKFVIRPGRMRTESETLREELENLKFNPAFEANRVWFR